MISDSLTFKIIDWVEFKVWDLKDVQLSGCKAIRNNKIDLEKSPFKPSYERTEARTSAPLVKVDSTNMKSKVWPRQPCWTG